MAWPLHQPEDTSWKSCGKHGRGACPEAPKGPESGLTENIDAGSGRRGRWPALPRSRRAAVGRCGRCRRVMARAGTSRHAILTGQVRLGHPASMVSVGFSRIACPGIKTLLRSRLPRQQASLLPGRRGSPARSRNWLPSRPEALRRQWMSLWPLRAQGFMPAYHSVFAHALCAVPFVYGRKSIRGRGPPCIQRFHLHEANAWSGTAEPTQLSRPATSKWHDVAGDEIALVGRVECHQRGDFFRLSEAP